VKFIIYLSPRTVAKYLAIIAAILAVFSIAFAVSTYVFDFFEEWMRMLDLDREMNIPTWFQSFMLACCAFLLTIIARGKNDESARYHRHWKTLSYIFWFMSADEVFSIHEIFIIPEIAEQLNLPWFLHSMWVIPGTIFVIWFAKHFWKFVQHLPKPTRDRFLLAAIIYISGSLGMEMVGSYYAEWKSQQDIIYALMANLEETLEMSGMIIFIYSLLTYLGTWQPDINIELKICDRNNYQKYLSS
jgi:hypothetical protein